MSLFIGDRLVKKITVPTKTVCCDFTPFTQGLHSFLGSDLQLKQVGLVSVVPQLEQLLSQVLTHELDLPVKLYNQASQIPLKLKVDIPAEVGADRALGAWSAYDKYASDLLVIDFGTAITFDLVSSSGEFEGGIIAPGVSISIKALTDLAARLPKVESFDQVGPLIGRNTQDCLRSAYFHGTAAMVKGLIAQISEQVGKSPKLIFTGGWVNQDLLKFFDIKGEYVPELLLEGLNCLLLKDHS